MLQGSLREACVKSQRRNRLLLFEIGDGFLPGSLPFVSVIVRSRGHLYLHVAFEPGELCFDRLDKGLWTCSCLIKIFEDILLADGWVRHFLFNRFRTLFLRALN